ncbi:MAG: XTP/dITP diphosphatase [Acidobacteria bacterium]|nr:XTP/dITP diphosphatase [Acidobacteriota bacterium]
MTTLLIATSNAGKVTELAAMLADLDCRVIGFSDLPEIPPTIEETGLTFAENALLKAEHYHHLTGLNVLADDSGLEVDALEGRPGVYSARYGGENLTSAQQIELLLGEMKSVPEAQRTARFVCSIALVGDNGMKQLFEGQCEGFIAHDPKGEDGFGYDPIFIDAELNRSFAELTREEKSSRSHRGKALAQARVFLADWLKQKNS